MVDCSKTEDEYKLKIPIPIGYIPDSEYSDPTARLGSLLMLMTSLTKERRRDGHFIPFSRDCWRRHFGGNASYVKDAARRSGLIDENDRYSTGMPGKKAFCKSIRLRDEHRTGKFALHELQRKPKQKPKLKLDQSRLKPVGIALSNQQSQFVLPWDFKACSYWEAFQLNRIRSADFYATRCDFGRFHSNFTGLRKSIRRDRVAADVDAFRWRSGSD